jgi:hypothetical protein
MRQIYYCLPLIVGGIALSTQSLSAAKAPTVVPVKFETRTGFKGTKQWDWTQVRSVHVPGRQSVWLSTMSLTGKTGTHAFHDVHVSTSRDGHKWTTPAVVPELRRFKTDDGYEVVAGDLWPIWHPNTGKILITGKTFNWKDGSKETFLREKVSYIIHDPKSGDWQKLDYLQMPKQDHAGHPILAANAGCNQPLPLDDGDVLLPVRYQRSTKQRRYTSIVVRCGFDGKTLTYKEHGSEHTFSRGRGFYEPSIGVHQGYYFLALRTDRSSFVARSNDGINFTKEREWTFDGGKPLGSHNTQQHWFTIGDGLFLLYTRSGANNDHIFRHRAPLFIGQVNPDTLQVMRATERILLKEDHATLGNSGVCQVSANEA